MEIFKVVKWAIKRPRGTFFMPAHPQIKTVLRKLRIDLGRQGRNVDRIYP